MAQVFDLDHDAVIVSWLPLFHDMGLIGAVLQAFYRGTACYLMPPAAFLEKPIRWLRAISRFDQVISLAPNFAYDHCVRHIHNDDKATLDLSGWVVAVNGSEPVRADTIERFIEAFRPCGFRRETFYPSYGLAEATLFVTGDPARLAPTITWLDPDALSRGHVALLRRGRAWRSSAAAVPGATAACVSSIRHRRAERSRTDRGDLGKGRQRRRWLLGGDLRSRVQLPRAHRRHK
jgi:acyl-CoA synthetase (AMP-forming)/AMP-acid ligase II